MRDPVLEELVFSRRGGVTLLAKKCGIKPQAISQWKGVPKNRVDAVARALGVDPSVFSTDAAA